MKIEIVRTQENDGDWYKVLVDGYNKGCWKVTDIQSENEALILAEKRFDELVSLAKRPELITVLKSIEI
jgi:hypothetical protein